MLSESKSNQYPHFALAAQSESSNGCLSALRAIAQEVNSLHQGDKLDWRSMIQALQSSTVASGCTNCHSSMALRSVPNWGLGFSPVACCSALPSSIGLMVQALSSFQAAAVSARSCTSATLQGTCANGLETQYIS